MPFRTLLDTLCKKHPVIRGAIFCDEEGERIERVRIDLDVSEFDLDIAGASFASLMPLLRNNHQQGTIRVVFATDVYWVQLLIDGCFILVIARHGDGRNLAIQRDLFNTGQHVIAEM